MPQIVAGIGNIFLGDDAFGCEVIRKMQLRRWPEQVRVVDFGIRGLDLAYCLLEEFTAVILVDALPRGEAPGTVQLLEPDLSFLQYPQTQEVIVDAHSMHPERVLGMASSMGATFTKLLLVGCEPTRFNADIDMQMELSEPVSAAIDEAIALIESVLLEILRDPSVPAGVAIKEPCYENRP